MLFTIWIINLFYIHNFRLQNLKFKHLIDDMTIDFWSSINFANMKDTRRKYNSIVDLSKFTSNKKILGRVVALSYIHEWIYLFFFVWKIDKNLFWSHEKVFNICIMTTSFIIIY